jgi:hypothetical protein
VGIDRQGVATVVWTTATGVESATGPTGRNGAFRVSLIARGSNPGFAEIAVTQQGNAYVVWETRRPLFTSSRQAGAQRWCPAVDLGLGGVAQIAPVKNDGMEVWQVPTEHPPSTYIAAHRAQGCHNASTQHNKTFGIEPFQTEQDVPSAPG